MGWAVGFDTAQQRFIGYGVPAVCEDPDCAEVDIDRGASHVCGGQPFGGEYGCGRFFCHSHLWYDTIVLTDEQADELDMADPRHLGVHGADVDVETGDWSIVVQRCARCAAGAPPYDPKPDTVEWVQHMLDDDAWGPWRDENPDQVEAMAARLAAAGVERHSAGTGERMVEVDSLPDLEVAVEVECPPAASVPLGRLAPHPDGPQ